MFRISRCASHNRPRQATGPTLTATMRASVAPEGVPKPGLSRPPQAPEQPQRADERRDRTGEEDPILASRTLSAGKKPAPQTSSANPRPHPDARETPSAHAASEFHVSAGNRSRRSRSPRSSAAGVFARKFVTAGKLRPRRRWRAESRQSCAHARSASAPKRSFHRAWAPDSPGSAMEWR
jgi:hypothetical protein